MTAVFDQWEQVDAYPSSVISLSRYAKIMGYDEASIWGVVYENQFLAGCDPLWNEWERLRLVNFLAEAQQEIEQVIHYPLSPRWITGTVEEEYSYDNRWVDQQYCRPRLLTKYPRLIEAGIRAEETIATGAAVVHGSTVGVVGPLATDATSTSEIVIRYPDGQREITPSKITIAGGQVTIEIPRYRMVVPELMNTPEGGVQYDNLDNFLSEVDVARVYNDPSKQATLVRPNCKNDLCYDGCLECTQSGCMYIRDPEVGIVQISPADWDATTSSWTVVGNCRSGYRLVRLYYRAGMRFVSPLAEMAIIRLAHAKMGEPPCSCDKISNIWQRDHNIPNFLTRQRLNCPFGQNDGSWIAYNWARSIASVRAAIL